MAILIKGMNGLPKSCVYCPCYYDGYCMAVCDYHEDEKDWYHREVDYKECSKKRADFCPLVLCEDDRVPCVDETLDEVMEEMCEYCRYPFEYKDSDDLIREQCNRCKVAKKVAEVLYGEDKSEAQTENRG